MDPHGTAPLLGDLNGNVPLGATGGGVHVDAAHHVPMPTQRAVGSGAAPHAPFPGLLPPTYRTLARCAPRWASAARDVGLLGPGGELGQIQAGFPVTHALVVMASAVVVPDAGGGADEAGADARLLAQGQDRSRALVAQLTHLAAFAPAHLAAGGLALAISP